MDQIMSNLGLLFEFPIVNLKIIIDGLMIGSRYRFLGTRHRLSTPSGWTSEYVDRPAQGVSTPPQVD